MVHFISSYRAQSVVLNDMASSSLPLLYGVPQGSVLRSIFFILYTQPLAAIYQPIPARIDYKSITLAYRRFDASFPPYLSSVLVIYQPSRSLRSSHE